MHWSKNLAYAVGLITTDGNLSKDGRHLSLVSKDLDQIQNFLHSIKINSKINKRASSYTGIKKYYFVQFSNVKLYKFLISVGLHPNKTKSLQELIIPDKYFSHFLRGHLDGDGYTYSYWDKRWKSSFMFYTGFLSASKRHLEWIKEKVESLYNIHGAIKYSGKSTYHLMYAKKSSISLVSKIYQGNNNIYLKRKRFKIKRALGIIRRRAGMLEREDRHV